jgi:hypothetical protein
MVEQRADCNPEDQTNQDLPGEAKFCLLHVITLTSSGLGQRLRLERCKAQKPETSTPVEGRPNRARKALWQAKKGATIPMHEVAV